MKRTTIMLPDDLAYLLERERRRRGVSAAAIVREAVAAHFNITSAPRHIPFAAIAEGGPSDLGSNFEQYLDQAWGSAEFFEETVGRPRTSADLARPNAADATTEQPSGPGVGLVVTAGTGHAATDGADPSR